MCRSIRRLRRPDDAGPATTGEAQAAALQYVRKISGYREPSTRNGEAFRAAVAEVTAATGRLLAALGTPVEDGPDPMADPATRRALLAARDAARGGDEVNTGDGARDTARGGTSTTRRALRPAAPSRPRSRPRTLETPS
ncbi:MAG: DUF2277 family protein [Chloroflexota bacterium]